MSSVVSTAAPLWLLPEDRPLPSSPARPAACSPCTTTTTTTTTTATTTRSRRCSPSRRAAPGGPPPYSTTTTTRHRRPPQAPPAPIFASQPPEIGPHRHSSPSSTPPTSSSSPPPTLDTPLPHHRLPLILSRKSRLRCLAKLAVFLLVCCISTITCFDGVAASTFPQPGYSSLGDGSLPFAIPIHQPGNASDLDYIFRTLPTSNPPWSPLISPVVNSAGDQFWAVLDAGGSVRLVWITSNGDGPRSSVCATYDVPGTHRIKKDEFGRYLFFLGLGSRSRDVLVLSWVESGYASSTLFVSGVKVAGSGSFGDASDLFSFSTSPDAVEFAPTLTDAGDAVFAAAEISPSSPCILKVDLSSEDSFISASCRSLGEAYTDSFYVSLADKDGKNLLLAKDGKGIMLPLNAFPLSAGDEYHWSNLPSSTSRLRFATGSPGFVLAIDSAGSSVVLYSGADRSNQPWTVLWTTDVSKSTMQSLPAAVDPARGRIFICGNVGSDGSGRIAVLDMASGVLLWEGSSCSATSTLVSSDTGDLLTSSQTDKTVSLVRFAQGGDDNSLQGTSAWTVSAGADGEALPPVVWQDDSSGQSVLLVGSSSLSLGNGDGTPGGPGGNSASASNPTGGSSSTTSSVTPSSSSSRTTGTVTSSSPLSSNEPTRSGPQPPATTSSVAVEVSSNGLSPGVISAIAIASIVAIILVAILFVFARRRQRSTEPSKSNHTEVYGDSATDGRTTSSLGAGPRDGSSRAGDSGSELRIPAPLFSPLPLSTNSDNPQQFQYRPMPGLAPLPQSASPSSSERSDKRHIAARQFANEVHSTPPNLVGKASNPSLNSKLSYSTAPMQPWQVEQWTQQAGIAEAAPDVATFLVGSTPHRSGTDPVDEPSLAGASYSAYQYPPRPDLDSNQNSKPSHNSPEMGGPAMQRNNSPTATTVVGDSPNTIPNTLSSVVAIVALRTGTSSAPSVESQTTASSQLSSRSDGSSRAAEDVAAQPVATAIHASSALAAARPLAVTSDRHSPEMLYTGGSLSPDIDLRRGSVASQATTSTVVRITRVEDVGGAIVDDDEGDDVFSGDENVFVSETPRVSQTSIQPVVRQDARPLPTPAALSNRLMQPDDAVFRPPADDRTPRQPPGALSSAAQSAVHDEARTRPVIPLPISAQLSSPHSPIIRPSSSDFEEDEIQRRLRSDSVASSIASSGYAGSISSGNPTLERTGRHGGPSVPSYHPEDDEQSAGSASKRSSMSSVSSSASSEYSGVAGPQWGRNSFSSNGEISLASPIASPSTGSWFPSWRWSGATTGSKRGGNRASGVGPPSPGTNNASPLSKSSTVRNQNASGTGRTPLHTQWTNDSDDDARWRDMVLGDRQRPQAHSSSNSIASAAASSRIDRAGTVSPAESSGSAVSGQPPPASATSPVPSMSSSSRRVVLGPAVPALDATWAASDDEESDSGSKSGGFVTATESGATSSGSGGSRPQRSNAGGGVEPRRQPSISSIGSFNSLSRGVTDTAAQVAARSTGAPPLPPSDPYMRRNASSSSQHRPRRPPNSQPTPGTSGSNRTTPSGSRSGAATSSSSASEAGYLTGREDPSDSDAYLSVAEYAVDNNDDDDDDDADRRTISSASDARGWHRRRQGGGGDGGVGGGGGAPDASDTDTGGFTTATSAGVDRSGGGVSDAFMTADEEDDDDDELDRRATLRGPPFPAGASAAVAVGRTGTAVARAPAAQRTPVSDRSGAESDSGTDGYQTGVE
ncbi:hypothetical protein DFJ73DRAFT_946508 [Zopfochytrium polystomum]|nr:hypothetical protein DFJ73DRAFT_946508 [Zopfochytrium polystomum]